MFVRDGNRPDLAHIFAKLFKEIIRVRCKIIGEKEFPGKS